MEAGGVIWQNRDVIVDVSETLANLIETAVDKAATLKK